MLRRRKADVLAECAQDALLLKPIANVMKMVG